MIAHSRHGTEDSTTLAGSELVRAGDASSADKDKVSITATSHWQPKEASASSSKYVYHSPENILQRRSRAVSEKSCLSVHR